MAWLCYLGPFGPNEAANLTIHLLVLSENHSDNKIQALICTVNLLPHGLAGGMTQCCLSLRKFLQLLAGRRGMMNQMGESNTMGYRISEDELQLTVSFAPDIQLTIELLLEAIASEFQIIGDSGRNNLWDIRNCRIDPNVNFITLREAVLHIKKMRDGKASSGKTAILVNSTMVYGIARTFQSIAEIKNIGFDIAVFDDRDLALAWLSNPAATSERYLWLTENPFNC
jgi:hypothetical protein